MLVSHLAGYLRKSRLQGQLVPLCPKPHDGAYRGIGQVGMMAETFALIHIRQMHFDKGYRYSEQRVAQGYAGMSQRAGVDNDEVDIFITGGMDAVDQLVFGIALQKLDVMARILRNLEQPRIDVCQRLFAVNFWLPAAKQVEIGAV